MTENTQQPQILLINSNDCVDTLNPGDLCEWADYPSRDAYWVTKESYRLYNCVAYMAKTNVARVGFSTIFAVVGADCLDSGGLELTLLDPVVGRWYFRQQSTQVVWALRKVVADE